MNYLDSLDLNKRMDYQCKWLFKRGKTVQVKGVQTDIARVEDK